MENRKREKCAHAGCSCLASSDSKYCSAYCESAKGKTEIACGCEHPGCAGKVS